MLFNLLMHDCKCILFDIQQVILQLAKCCFVSYCQRVAFWKVNLAVDLMIFANSSV